MDRLARDAQARYGSSSGGGGGGGYPYPSSSGRRESRRASHASSRRFENVGSAGSGLDYLNGLGALRRAGSSRETRYEEPQYESGLDRLNRLAAERRAAPPREESHRRERAPLRAPAYEGFSRSTVFNREPLTDGQWARLRGQEVGLRPSFSPSHDEPRRPSTLASYRRERSRARHAERERADWHHSELFDAAESNRANAEQWVRTNHRVRDHDFGGTRTLRNYEVPARYGGGDRLTEEARRRAERGERRGSWHFF